MVMIIFNLIVFFNVMVSLFSYFLTPLCLFSWPWWMICSLMFSISFGFLFLFFFFFWGGLGYIFGCDLNSYSLILLSLWICILMILARESIFCLDYFSETGSIGYSETSVNNSQSTLHNMPEEQRSHLIRGGRRNYANFDPI